MFRQREPFNILVSERRMRHSKLRNKDKLMRDFETGYLVLVSKQVKSIRKEGISQKLVLKTKIQYRVLEKTKHSSYWLQRFPFCEGLGRPGRKVKEFLARMENIPYTMVIHKHLDGTDTRFSTMAVPLANNPL